MPAYESTKPLQKYEKDILAKIQQTYKNDTITMITEQNKLYSQLDYIYKDSLRNDVELSRNKTVKEFFQIIEDNYDKLENPYDTIAFLNDNVIFSLDISEIEYLNIEKNWRPTIDNSKYYTRTTNSDLYTVYFKNSTLFLEVSYENISNNERQIQDISIIRLLRTPSIESPKCINE